MAFIFPTLAVIIIVGLFRPLATKFDNNIEIFDSITVLALSYCLFSFSDFTPDPHLRYKIGYAMIFLTCQNMFINIFLMMKDPLIKFIAKLKYSYTIRERLKKKFTFKYF